MMVTVSRDLRLMFGPVRDQHARPTCLAFAASDCHAALRDGGTPLSCEFAFYHAQRRGHRSPHVGATLSTMLDAIGQDGQPVEADWPYLAAVPTDISAWVPPKTVTRVFRRDGERRSNHFDEIVSQLDKDRPVLVLMMLSDAFYMPDADGVVIIAPGEMPDPTRRHAAVAVAHGQLRGERAILLRNSWGAAWGVDGHAWLTEKFLAPRLTRVAILTGSADVLAN